MPRIKSAIKRVLVAERNRARNRAWKAYIRTARNKVADAIKSADTGVTTTALSEAFSKIDRAVAKGILHKNTAARRKARLTAAVRKALKIA